jgi:hypothetical protein
MALHMVAGSKEKKCGLKYVIHSQGSKPTELLAPLGCSGLTKILFPFACESRQVNA